MAGLVLQKLQYFSCNEATPAMKCSSCLIADTKATKLWKGVEMTVSVQIMCTYRRMTSLALCDSGFFFSPYSEERCVSP